MSLPLEAREDLSDIEADITAKTSSLEIIDTPASDAPHDLLLFEQAETDRKFLIPGHSLEQREDTRLKPWSHLPKGAFYIEDGAIVAFTGSEPISRRAREDAAASKDADNLVFSSGKRQAASHRTNTNTRRGSGLTGQQRGLRPQQSRKR